MSEQEIIERPSTYEIHIECGDRRVTLTGSRSTIEKNLAGGLQTLFGLQPGGRLS